MVEGCSTFEYSPEWSFFTVDQEVAAGARQLALVQESLNFWRNISLGGPTFSSVAKRSRGSQKAARTFSIL